MIFFFFSNNVKRQSETNMNFFLLPQCQYLGVLSVHLQIIYQKILLWYRESPRCREKMKHIPEASRLSRDNVRRVWKYFVLPCGIALMSYIHQSVYFFFLHIIFFFNFYTVLHSLLDERERKSEQSWVREHRRRDQGWKRGNATFQKREN